MGKKTGEFCIGHRNVQAEFFCTKCKSPLCPDCVNPDAHLLFCAQCGGLAQRMVSVSDEQTSMHDTANDASVAIKELLFGVVNHIFLPVAIITMVSAFLFFLLDVRSLYWVGGGSLKRIGFFFAMATVLIARYGKVHAQEGRQLIYTGVLAFGTLVAMLQQVGFGMGLMVNILVILVVWRFATGVTNNLNVEEPEETQTIGEMPLYGLARIEHEAMEKKHNLQQPNIHSIHRKSRSLPKKQVTGWKRFLIPPQDPHGNSAGAVARLAGMAILVFALGEPLILAGPPEVGLRALMDVMVFLFSTGIVLAAASAVGTYHHSLSAGGKGAIGLVPMKVFVAMGLMVVVLALGLSVPGLRYEGSGKIQPPKSQSGKGQISGKEDKKGDSSGERDQSQPDQSKSGSGKNGRSKAPVAEGVNSIMNFFTQLGKLLLYPAVIIFVGFLIYALFKLMPLWRGMGLGNRWRQWLEKLRARLKFRREKKTEEKEQGPDPLALLGKLSGLPPREAIIGAYGCLLAFMQRAGHAFMPRLTPYEILATLPHRLSESAEPARLLTDIYVKTAFSRVIPTTQESSEALTHLFQVKQILDTSTTKS